MNDKFLCLILSQQDYRDKDALVSVLIKGIGKVKLISKSVRKLTSKNSSSLSPFMTSLVIFDYKENSSIFTLKTSSIIKRRKNINQDLLKVAIGSIFINMIEVNSDVDDFYDLLEFSLDKLDEETNPYTIACLFVARFLYLLGIGPQVDECVFCGTSKIVGLSISDGGFVCRSCLSKTEVYKNLDHDRLRKFRLINKAKEENYDVLIDIGYDDVDFKVLMDFYLYHTYTSMKSYEFFKSIV